MVKYIMFSDPLRAEEIEKFYLICQMHRDYYRGYPKSFHPLHYFLESNYTFQCPSEMSVCYLSFPAYHINYKQPIVLPQTLDRTSEMPTLPERTLGARYGPTTKSFMR